MFRICYRFPKMGIGALLLWHAPETQANHGSVESKLLQMCAATTQKRSAAETNLGGLDKSVRLCSGNCNEVYKAFRAEKVAILGLLAANSASGSQDCGWLGRDCNRFIILTIRAGSGFSLNSRAARPTTLRKILHPGRSAGRLGKERRSGEPCPDFVNSQTKIYRPTFA